MKKKRLFTNMLTAMMLMLVINASIVTAAGFVDTYSGSGTDTEPCSITIHQDLSFTIPHAAYESGGPLLAQTMLQIEFQYAGEQDGQLLWKLGDVRISSPHPSCAITIASDMSFEVKDAMYDAGPPADQMALQMGFAYAGEQNGDYLWRLASLATKSTPSVPVEPDRIRTNFPGMTFVHIPAGTFVMGAPSEEPFRVSYETRHTVTLTRGYYIQTTEVTQGQWEAVMGDNPSHFTNCGPDCPVEQVSWDDIHDFIARLNQRGEGTYALPTEAQWEYAARAGTDTAFANGEITEKSCGYDPNLDAMGWYCGNSEDRTHPVGCKQPNDWGLYDMHGNVWEWVADWYEDYPVASVVDPAGPSIGLFRVIRGGSWNRDASYCRSAFRNVVTPEFRYNNAGFRLVFSPGKVHPAGGTSGMFRSVRGGSW